MGRSISQSLAQVHTDPYCWINLEAQEKDRTQCVITSLIPISNHARFAYSCPYHLPSPVQLHLLISRALHCSAQHLGAI